MVLPARLARVREWTSAIGHQELQAVGSLDEVFGFLDSRFRKLHSHREVAFFIEGDHGKVLFGGFWDRATWQANCETKHALGQFLELFLTRQALA